ncbi:hypothetical protein AG1IA_04882 [Rhizoctonia solani AG-1 IA]|uniref:Uncharacterized protein n=1 Tax=Thanatephorus cucumeris (strain AG1-IA) TaxID=983506 RepID=L8WXJ5_THACA|nr:hypothetical protein AG1IA_04882 [Rhizoctonia solani AG-1 IA]
MRPRHASSVPSLLGINPENQYISKRLLFSVGYGLKITMLVCLPQHESDYGIIDTSNHIITLHSDVHPGLYTLFPYTWMNFFPTEFGPIISLLAILALGLRAADADYVLVRVEGRYIQQN